MGRMYLVRFPPDMPEVSNDEERILLYTIRLDVPKRFSSTDKEYTNYRYQTVLKRTL